MKISLFWLCLLPIHAAASWPWTLGLSMGAGQTSVSSAQFSNPSGSSNLYTLFADEVQSQSQSGFAGLIELDASLGLGQPYASLRAGLGMNGKAFEVKQKIDSLGIERTLAYERAAAYIWVGPQLAWPWRLSAALWLKPYVATGVWVDTASQNLVRIIVPGFASKSQNWDAPGNDNGWLLEAGLELSSTRLLSHSVCWRWQAGMRDLDEKAAGMQNAGAWFVTYRMGFDSRIWAERGGQGVIDFEKPPIDRQSKIQRLIESQHK